MATSMTAQPQSPFSDEAKLVRQALTDAEAFAELYRRHVKHVYRYHIAHTGDIKDAEDLTSQTFMAALESIRSFRGEGPFAAWLMGIASRKRALFFRGRRPQVPLEAATELPDGSLATDEAAGQLGRPGVALGLGEVPLEDGVGRPLAELGLEDRRERQPPTRPIGADGVRLVSGRRHRRSR